jgi:uncharacterized protein (TIGR02145 family)
LASGAGSLTFTITGTPSAAGTADFALSIGGQSCSLSWTVNSLWSPGYVNCVSQATVIVDVTNPATGKTWMDRNLGAIQAGTSFNDPDSYGDLYQWGRMADGHQCRTSPATNSTSNGDQPGHGNWIKVSGDWRSPSNDNLWQGVNGINNPCPSGYRLPTEAELADELATWIGTNWSGNKTSAAAFGSPLKWTGSGHRDGNNNFIYFTGIRGTVWSSTISGTNARFLGFDDCQITCTGMGTTSRSTGLSVRCIKN